VRRFPTLVATLAVVLVAAFAQAQEIIPPVWVGGGQSDTRIANGQTVQVIATGVSVTVNFTEISAQRVTGVVVRTSTGTSAGTVTIRWVTRGRETTLQVGPANPEVPFGMEGGDIDRRTGTQTVEPSSP
jgi:hypothetical protein